MRITIHLSTFDELNPCAYAIVWIDREARKWSREEHAVLGRARFGVDALNIPMAARIFITQSRPTGFAFKRAVGAVEIETTQFGAYKGASVQPYAPRGAGERLV